MRTRLGLVIMMQLVILSAGCATRYHMGVTSYQSPSIPFPAPGEHNKVAVIADTEPDEPLLELEVARKIGAMLRSQGYEVGRLEAADFVLLAVFSIDSGATDTGVAPIFHPGGSSTSNVYTSTGQWASMTTYHPGTTSYVPYSYTYFTRLLGMTIVHKDRWLSSEKGDHSDATVWRSTTVSAGSSSDLRTVIDYLIVGTFEYFGKDTGKRQSITLTEGDRHVKRMRLSATELDSALFRKPTVSATSVKPERQLVIANPPPGGAVLVPPSVEAAGGSSVIESRVDGEFEGFEGETVVKLMDGSIWQQQEFYHHYHYGYMLPVVVFRSGAGWKMQVQGVPKAVKVSRLK